MNWGQWKTALIDIDRAVDGFAGDDVDQYSELVDLGWEYEYLIVEVPTITSATVSIVGQRGSAITTVPLPIHILDDDATGSFLHATTAGTTSLYVIFRIGGLRYIRILAAGNQAADRTFYVRGFNRS